MDFYPFCFCSKAAEGALNWIEAAGLRVCLHSLPMLFSQSISLPCLKHLFSPTEVDIIQNEILMSEPH